MGPAGGGKSRQMRDLAHYSTGVPAAFYLAQKACVWSFRTLDFRGAPPRPGLSARGKFRPAGFSLGIGPPLGGKSAMKKLLVILIFLAAVGGGVYYWLHRTAPADQIASGQPPAPAPGSPQGQSTAPKPRGAHPMPGDTVEKEQPFFESDYGF